jgi:hypothetical protein
MFLVRGVPVCVALIVLCGLAPGAGADKYAAEFLKVGAGARALGMGGAFVALADDASAVYWNPAGLVSLVDIEVEAMHAEQFGDIVNYDFLAAGFPSSQRREKSAMALISLPSTTSITQGSRWEDWTDGVQGTSDLGEANGEWDPGERILLDEGKIVWKNTADMALLLSYATQLNNRFRIGGTFKLVRQELMDNSSLGAGVDLGVIYSISKSASLGAVLSDATTTQLVGYAPWSSSRPLFAWAVSTPGDSWTEGRGYWTWTWIEKRRWPASSGEPLTADVRAGLGLGEAHSGSSRDWTVASRRAPGEILEVWVDYAFLSHKDLDNSHRVSASARF